MLSAFITNNKKTGILILNVHLRVFGLILYFLFAGCRDKLNDDIAEKFKNDKKLDQSEYNSLRQMILENQSEYSQFVKEGKFDSQKFNNYLLSHSIVNRLKIEKNEIYLADISISKPVKLHAFIENSASMDGYVEGVTGFENSVYNLLSDLKIMDEMVRNLNLYYINSAIPFKKTDALPNDIEDFIQKLSPAEFKQKGGQRGVSDIKMIIDTVLKFVKEDEVVVLVSDFVFSPGAKSAQDYLVAQKIGIKISIDEKVKKGDFSVLVLRYSSSFNGVYYDYKNSKHQYTGERPFYIWLIGPVTVIDRIIDAKIYERSVNPPQEMVYLSKSILGIQLNYKVSKAGKRGNFSFDAASKGKILVDCESASSGKYNGQFGFNLKVDYSGIRLPAEYLKDSTNYTVSDNYSIEKIETLDTDKSNGYTHQIFVKTNMLRDTDLKITLLNKLPKWVSKYSSINDSNILADQNEKSKTFGLEYLISGVYDAFQNTADRNVITSFKISIEQ